MIASRRSNSNFTLPFLSNPMKQRLSSLYQCLGQISLILALPACSNLKPVQDFGGAATAFTASANAAYLKFDEELSRVRYVTASLEDPEVKPEAFDGFLAVNDRQAVREKALTEMGKYAQAVEALASKDFRADIAGAVTEFDTNLNSLGASYTKLSGKSWPISKGDTAILSTVVKVAADAYVEHKRKQALRTLIPKTDTAVQAVCTMLASEFESFGGVLEGHYTEQRNKLLDRFNAKRAAMAPSEIVTTGDMIKTVHDRIQQVGPYYDSVSKAAMKVAKAHSSMTQSVATREFTTKEFIADVKVLIAYAKEVQAFHSKLK